ncbi:MAG: Pr6Pr family membrane protein [Spirochaetaceae bacterium]|nr:Pr6Pr family membrane protein [Spirochaetaceae bacterium]
MTKMQKISLILNLLIFISVVFAIISMLTGFHFMTEPGKAAALSTANARAFKYFTVDSNLLAGLVSLAAAICTILKATGRIKTIPEVLPLFKLASTTGVTLTMLITALFLAPFQFGFFALFVDSNLFMHLLIPLLCIIVFVFFEPAHISARQTFAGVVPMLIYGVFYGTNIILHLGNGQTSQIYDWYGFLGNGVNTIGIVALTMFSFTLLIAWSLRIANEKFANHR